MFKEGDECFWIGILYCNCKAITNPITNNLDMMPVEERSQQWTIGKTKSDAIDTMIKHLESMKDE